MKSPYTMEALKAYKELETYQFFVSGWVREPVTANINDKCGVKARVSTASVFIYEYKEYLWLLHWLGWFHFAWHIHWIPCRLYFLWMIYIDLVTCKCNLWLWYTLNIWATHVNSCWYSDSGPKNNKHVGVNLCILSFIWENSIKSEIKNFFFPEYRQWIKLDFSSTGPSLTGWMKLL